MFATETVYIQKCWALETMIDYVTISCRKRHEYRLIVIVDYSRNKIIDQFPTPKHQQIWPLF